MFLNFYNLHEQPFGVTPDPRFLCLTETHREALASLYYGIEEGRGFAALVAPPGMGKTTLLFQLMERLRGSACWAFLFQTQCDSDELLRYILTDMGVDFEGDDQVKMHDMLNRELVRLKQTGTRFVLIIDEAQNLDDSVLESVRLLSDFETQSSKLLQIVLAGQPGLADKLWSPQLTQMRQRIAIWARLEPLTAEQVSQYIDRRLSLAGYTGDPLFTPEAQALIAWYSRGIPRNINSLCFSALSLGYALGKSKIDGPMINEAASDCDLCPSSFNLQVPAFQNASDPKENSSISHAPKLSGRVSFKSLHLAALALCIMAAGVLAPTLLPGGSQTISKWLRPAPVNVLSTSGSAANSGPHSGPDPARVPSPSSPSPSHVVAADLGSRKGDSSAPSARVPSRLPMTATSLFPTVKGDPIPRRSSGELMGPLPPSVRHGGARDGEKLGNSRRAKGSQVASAGAHEARRRAIEATLWSPGEVRFVTVPSGLQVFLDGKSIGPSPVESLAEPGWHTYSVNPPPGGEGIRRSFDVKPAALVVETVKWGSEGALRDKPPAPALFSTPHEPVLKDPLGADAKTTSSPAGEPGATKEKSARKGTNDE